MRGDTPVLVEAGARLSGAYIPRALALAGVDWGAATLDILGEVCATSVPTLAGFVAIEYCNGRPSVGKPPRSGTSNPGCPARHNHLCA